MLLLRYSAHQLLGGEVEQRKQGPAAPPVSSGLPPSTLTSSLGSRAGFLMGLGDSPALSSHFLAKNELFIYFLAPHVYTSRTCKPVYGLIANRITVGLDDLFMNQVRDAYL